MALAPAFTPQGLRSIFGTFYRTDYSGPTTSRIENVALGGTAPTYSLPKRSGLDEAGEIYETVLKHIGDESPWVIDAHLYYDADTKRLWMTWGGHNCWITELDPATGAVLEPTTRQPLVGSTEFTSHPAGVHTRILGFQRWQGGGANYPAGLNEAPASWEGDAYATQAYMEGPNLWKHGGYWYACGSYGSMDDSYTIRCCRSAYNTSSVHTGARGPYYDKQGLQCTSFYPSANRYGASMLLGPDGDQLVPGHPHIWVEPDDTTFYLGYDYRRGRPTSADYMGIRRLYWHKGWPTIWTPLTLVFQSDAQPSSVGQQLTLEFRNTGDRDSKAAFDGFRVLQEGPLPPASPSPPRSATPLPPQSSPPSLPSPSWPTFYCAYRSSMRSHFAGACHETSGTTACTGILCCDPSISRDQGSSWDSTRFPSHIRSSSDALAQHDGVNLGRCLATSLGFHSCANAPWPTNPNCLSPPPSTSPSPPPSIAPSQPPPSASPLLPPSVSPSPPSAGCAVPTSTTCSITMVLRAARCSCHFDWDPDGCPKSATLHCQPSAVHASRVQRI